MAKSKKMRVVKYSPVYGPQGEEIGHVVEDQLITVIPGGKLLPITDPCPWGFSGIQARVPAEAVEVFSNKEAPAPSIIEEELKDEPQEVIDAVPPESEG